MHYKIQRTGNLKGKGKEKEGKEKSKKKKGLAEKKPRLGNVIIIDRAKLGLEEREKEFTSVPCLTEEKVEGILEKIKSLVEEEQKQREEQLEELLAKKDLDNVVEEKDKQLFVVFRGCVDHRDDLISIGAQFGCSVEGVIILRKLELPGDSEDVEPVEAEQPRISEKIFTDLQNMDDFMKYQIEADRIPPQPKRKKKKAKPQPPVPLTMQELSAALTSKMSEHVVLKDEYLEWIGTAKLSVIPLLKDPADEQDVQPEDGVEEPAVELKSEDMAAEPSEETAEQHRIALSMYNKVIPRGCTTSVAWVLDTMCSCMNEAVIELERQKEKEVADKKAQELAEGGDKKAEDVTKDLKEEEVVVEHEIVEWLVPSETKEDKFELLVIPPKKTNNMKLYPQGDLCSIRCEVAGFDTKESEIEKRMWGHLLLPRHNKAADIDDEKRKIMETHRKSHKGEFASVQFEKALLIAQFNEIMKTFGDGLATDEKVVNKDWEFNQRKHIEEFDTFRLKQIISDALSKRMVEIRTRYIDYSDSTLLVAHIHTPHTRQRVTDTKLYLYPVLNFPRWLGRKETGLPPKPISFYGLPEGRDIPEEIVNAGKCFYPCDQAVFGRTTNDCDTRFWLRKGDLELSLSIKPSYTRIIFSDGVQVVVESFEEASTSKEKEAPLGDTHDKADDEKAAENDPKIEAAKPEEEADEEEKKETAAKKLEVLTSGPMSHTFMFKDGSYMKVDLQKRSVWFYKDAPRYSKIEHEQKETSDKKDEVAGEETDALVNENEEHTEKAADEEKGEIEAPEQTEIDQTERWRCIRPDGSVFLEFHDGSQAVLFPNGCTWKRKSPREVWEKQNMDENDESGLKVALVVDWETGAKVRTREDLTMSICYENGDMVSQFSDGTRIYSFTERQQIAIETWNVSRILLDDSRDPSVEITLPTTKTKVLLKTDGANITRLFIQTPSSGIIASWTENSRNYMVYQPSAKNLKKMDEDLYACRAKALTSEKKTPVGQYWIDCNSFTVNHYDAEENGFALGVDMDSCELAIAKSSVLPGETTEEDTIPLKYYEIPQNPIQPRLFVIVDGNGYEILHEDEFNRLQTLVDQSGETTALPTVDLEFASETAKCYRFLTNVTVRDAPYRRKLEITNIVKSTWISPFVHLKMARENRELEKFATWRTILEYEPFTKEQIDKAQENYSAYLATVEELDKKDKLFGAKDVNEDAGKTQALKEQQNKLRKEYQEALRLFNNENQTQSQDQPREYLSNPSVTESPQKIKKERTKKPRPTIEKRQTTKEVNYYRNVEFLRAFKIGECINEITSEFPNPDTKMLIVSVLRKFGKILLRTLRVGVPDDVQRIDLTKQVHVQNFGKLLEDKTFSFTLSQLLTAMGYEIKIGVWHRKKSIVFIDAAICELFFNLDKVEVHLKKLAIKAVKPLIKSTDDLEFASEDNPQLIETEQTESSEQSQRLPTMSTSISKQADRDVADEDFEHSADPTHYKNRLKYRPSKTSVTHVKRKRPVSLIKQKAGGYSTKADYIVNEGYLIQEGDAVNKIKTASTIMVDNSLFPEAEVHPKEFDFGDIQIGVIYRFKASLLNNGHKILRFQVQQPTVPTEEIESMEVTAAKKTKAPPKITDGDKSFCHVLYRRGPLAPGLALQLEVELRLKDSGPFETECLIFSEAQIWVIPIKAVGHKNLSEKVNRRINQRTSAYVEDDIGEVRESKSVDINQILGKDMEEITEKREKSDETGN